MNSFSTEDQPDPRKQIHVLVAARPYGLAKETRWAAAIVRTNPRKREDGDPHLGEMRALCEPSFGPTPREAAAGLPAKLLAEYGPLKLVQYWRHEFRMAEKKHQLAANGEAET